MWETSGTVRIVRCIFHCSNRSCCLVSSLRKWYHLTELLVKQRLLAVEQAEEYPEAVFARRTREVRVGVKITQTELSAHVDIQTSAAGRPVKMDPTAITKLEKGTRAIRLNEAVAIANVLDQTVDEMLRPALASDEQIRRAESQIETTRLRAAMALGEHEAAIARAARLRELLGGGDDDGAGPDVGPAS